MGKNKKSIRCRSDGIIFNFRVYLLLAKGKPTLTAQANNNAGSPQQKWGKNPESNLTFYFKNILRMETSTSLINWIRWGKQEQKKKENELRVSFFFSKERKKTQIQLSEPSLGNPSKSLQGPINLHRSGLSVIRSRLLKVLNISWIKQRRRTAL